MEPKSTDGPLKGIQILDLARLYPGPLAAMMAAQMGAEVVKIEDPENPDPMRFYPPFVKGQSAGHLAVNAHKKSLALKLRAPEGRAIFHELVKQADVLIEGFRPGVMAANNLDYQQLRQINPRLVYISLTGYGQTGPYAQTAGHDLNYIAYAGVLAATGGPDPVAPGPQIADVAGAYMTLNAITAALFARERTGYGQYADISMLDGVLPFMTLQLAHQRAAPGSSKRGQSLLSGGAACYSVYPCKCGRFVALAALEQKFWEAFCRAVNRPDWVDQQFAKGPQAMTLKTEVKTLFQQKTRDQWMTLAAQEDLCLSPVLELDEVDKDPQLQSRNMIQTDDSGHKIQGFPIKFSKTPTSQAPKPAPSLGQHSLQILKEAGLSDETIKELSKKGLVKI